MPIKKTNMIVPIFIIVLLLALYIFTNNSVNRTNKIEDMVPRPVIPRPR
jgi:hypothetical protein